MRKGYWECDNCQTKVFEIDFPKTWIHLKNIMLAEGVCIFGFYRPTAIVSQPDYSAYRKEFDKTFCSKDCFVKYMSKMLLINDSNFNPSMKV